MSLFNPAAAEVMRFSTKLATDNQHAKISIWTLLPSLFMYDKDDDTLLLKMVDAGLDTDAFERSIMDRLDKAPKSSGSVGGLKGDGQYGDLLEQAIKRAHPNKATNKELWIELLLLPEIQEFMEKVGLDTVGRRKVLASEGADDTALGKYCRDLTNAAALGELDPIIGRDDEIREAMNILQRRSKNNPIFVGEPGVGKTALVEGLAHRMLKNEVPETLKNKRLLSLDVGSIVAGAKFKGELEERVKGLVREIQESDDVVLFIDEIHTLVSASGEASAVGQLLKPALARGELRCIGATTPDEYRYNLEKDPALERRFQRITVEEPSHEDAIAILRGVKEPYALHHGVDITDSALVAAVELSARYITDRKLPDKAIDLMDAAAARVRTVLDSKPEALDRLDRRMVQLKVQREALKKESFNEDLDEDTQERLRVLEEGIQQVESESLDLEQRWLREKELHDNVINIQEDLAMRRHELEEAQRNQDLATMSEIQYSLIPTLETQLRVARREIRSLPDQMMQDQVNADQIAEVVARRTGIPVSKMKGGEQTRLAEMEQIIGDQVIGQPEAVEAVSDAVRRSRSGLSDPGKPIGSFLFLGPTGVGKTELTKVLASFLFEKKDAMVRLDMSEFMEKQSVARMIGAPPGYVGYEEGGMLTEAVRHSPYSVILFDEVEKAHPDVFNVLLQVLDDGHLTDGQGRTVDFKNTVIIMTSNLGAGDIQEMTRDGASAEEIKDSVMENVRGFFRPEFINRLDESVIFRPLDRPAIARIAQLQMKRVIKRLEDRKIDTTITEAAVAHLAEAGFDPLMGARPLKRAIQQELENPLSKEIVSGRLNSGDTLVVDSIEGKLVWNVTAAVSEDDMDLDEAPVSVSDELSASKVAKRATSRRPKASGAKPKMSA